ncbi:CaiB/BaiF CoA transferase family protein [Burkholderia plantarii]|uniref:CaiB/BaiF CoA transferase family protein n=1 Tax=Burkholderia plantarii TaxID=41899 RepID=UPI0007063F63|nr:CaiB/BaiF CoA-transferase family protein [Burkholderia plantarii]ALK35274.1 alpha-methylacyl-CoA racemase [Burkholderia plantarii]WLE64092.1 CoA transferase [Burkholderia plantarii]GLZ23230.1 alpha-methylacyl-CoA racemase [Burkholderia plantarii]
MSQAGPLNGLKVVEFGAIGPVPFCAMLLADMGADVVQITRPNVTASESDFIQRGRRFVSLDLKSPESRDEALRLVSVADVVLEGNRPGVMEKLGLGPDTCLARNPRLVYGRMTGWGQQGPFAASAGHDINYIAVTGALDAIGTQGRPIVPLNLVGDYGGGSMFLAFGILAALLAAQDSGQGQVIDAAMVDGASYLMSLFYRLRAQGKWRGPRATNELDGGAPWYDTYKTLDEKWVAVGAIEEPFWQLMLTKLGIAPEGFLSRKDRSNWPAIRVTLERLFGEKTRDEWSAIFDGTDACVSPVLTMDEAHENEHLKARHTFVKIDGIVRPAPAPRFSSCHLAHLRTSPGKVEIKSLIGSWGD